MEGKHLKKNDQKKLKEKGESLNQKVVQMTK